MGNSWKQNLLDLWTRSLFTMDFWSVPQVSCTVPAGAASQTLPDVVVANLPSGATILVAKGMFKFRVVGNTHATLANNLSGAQHIQIQKGGGGGYADCISLVDLMFAIAAVNREGGDVMIGDHNVVAKVSANDTYNFQWTSANAAQANLVFYDIQTGIRIWYSV